MAKGNKLGRKKARAKTRVAKSAAFEVGQRVKVIGGGFVNDKGEPEAHPHGNAPGSVIACQGNRVTVRLDAESHNEDGVVFDAAELVALP